MSNDDEITLFMQEMADVRRLHVDVQVADNGQPSASIAQLARRQAAELEPNKPTTQTYYPNR